MCQTCAQSGPSSAFQASGTGREYSLGWRLRSDGRDGGSPELSFEARRREGANDNADAPRVPVRLAAEQTEVLVRRWSGPQKRGGVRR